MIVLVAGASFDLACTRRAVEESAYLKAAHFLLAMVEGALFLIQQAPSEMDFATVRDAPSKERRLRAIWCTTMRGEQ